jgi:glucokinase
VSAWIGIDIGGTNIKIATVSDAGRVLVRGVVETTASEGPASAFRRIHDAARQLAVGQRVRGVGIGCAGLIDARRGVLRESPNLPAWRGAPLLRLAKSHFRLPVIVENDATSAGFGESFVRGARGRDLVFITLGTGVGGGIVTDGRVVRGVSGFGGEIGHMTVDPDGPLCHCGSRGCLEAYAGAYGIVRAAREAAQARGKRSGRWARASFNARDVLDAARRGDAIGRAAARVAGEHLGLAIASLLNVLNPSVVVIGGGVGGGFDVLSPHVRRMIASFAFADAARAARIETSRLGNDAALVGAAMLARAHATRPKKTTRVAS